MSRMTPKSRTGNRGALALSEQQKALDLRLVETVVEFMNGASAAVFDWVGPEFAQLADRAGVRNYTPRTRLEFDRHQWKQPEYAEAGLRSYVTAVVSFLGQYEDLSRAEMAAVRDRLNDVLATFQLVTAWQVGDRGALDEVTVPRLDTVDRCCAYVLGLMLLDRHNLRHGIKQCQLRKVILRIDGEAAGWMPHYFIDLPNTKRLYCCDQHAATDRKRRQRQQ